MEVFDVNGVKKTVGSSGPTGPTGPAGPTGIPGFDGQDGLDGLDGFPGSTGPAGNAGAPGATGPAGLQGPIGFPGFDGEDGLDSLIPGPPGANGAAGAPGATGPAGLQGPPGIPGLDAEEPNEPLMIPGPQGPAGSAGSGASLTRIAGNSGAAGADFTAQHLTANSADQTSVTPAAVMTTTGVGVGTWLFRYTVIFQTAATTTGIRLNVNHTGTVTLFQSRLSFTDTSATAATGVGKGLATAAIGSVPSEYQEQAKDTTTFASVGVAVINSNILATLEGIIVVSVSGDLQLKLGTEVAASAVRLMANSSLLLVKM